MEKLDKRLEDIEKRQEQLKEQRKNILSKKKAKERKERTKRLIEKGAILEKAFNIETLTPEQTQKLLLEISRVPKVTEILNKGIPAKEKTERPQDEKKE